MQALVETEKPAHAHYALVFQETEPIYEAVDKHGIEVTHLLLTHHHHDHVAQAAEVKRRYGVPPRCRARYR